MEDHILLYFDPELVPDLRKKLRRSHASEALKVIIEKGIFEILKSNAPIDLNELKALSCLSNKKWDKAIKSLTKHGVAKVNKTDEGLFIDVA